MNKDISKAQLLLTVVSITALLISNIISTKQFLLPFGITFTGAVIVFPITYILSDIFSEVYGYRWSRITCYLGFAMNLFMVLIFQLSIAMPYPAYWTNQESFSIILGNAPRILVASFLAYIVGDFVNDRVFRKMKEKKQGMQGFKTRAIVSSVCGEVVDSTIFISVAFAGQMPLVSLVILGLTEMIIKIIYEICIVPITAILAKRLIVIENRNKGITDYAPIQ